MSMTAIPSPHTIHELRAAWPDVMASLLARSRVTWILMSRAYPEAVHGRVILVCVGDLGAVSAFARLGRSDAVTGALAEVTGVAYLVEVEHRPAPRQERPDIVPPPPENRPASPPAPAPVAPLGAAPPDARRVARGPGRRAQVRTYWRVQRLNLAGDLVDARVVSYSDAAQRLAARWRGWQSTGSVAISRSAAPVEWITIEPPPDDEPEKCVERS